MTPRCPAQWSDWANHGCSRPEGHNGSCKCPCGSRHAILAPKPAEGLELAK